jgi:hypothetical protein
MPQRYEDVARRVAQKLAARMGASLPERTEYVLREADVFDDDEPLEDFDVAGVALASLLVNTAKVGCDIHAGMMRDGAAEWAPTLGASAAESPAEKLARRLRAGVETQLSSEQREAVIQAVVAELVAAGGLATPAD